MVCPSDNVVHWRCTAGDEKGREGRENAHRVAVRDGVHLLSWVENDGTVIAQVIDFAAGSVNCVLVAGGERILLQGTLRKVA